MSRGSGGRGFNWLMHNWQPACISLKILEHFYWASPLFVYGLFFSFPPEGSQFLHYYKLRCLAIDLKVNHFTKYHFAKYRFAKYRFAKYHFAKYRFAKYHFAKYHFAKYHFAKYRFAKYHFAKYHFAKYHFAKYRIAKCCFAKYHFVSFCLFSFRFAKYRKPLGTLDMVRRGCSKAANSEDHFR